MIRAGVLTVARLVLLAGPTALAFFTGGYFPEAQAWAGLGAWLLVAVALLAGPWPPRLGRPFWLAAGGLLLLGAWSLLSVTWAPIRGNAYHSGQLVLVYAGALAAAALLLSASPIRRWVEPALAAGALIVIGYGLAERLLPGVLHFAAFLQRARPARAAAHILERDGGAGRDRIRAGSRARRRPRPARMATDGGGGRRGAARDGRCTCRFRAARCSRARRD